MDEIYELYDYLPVLYKDEDELKYINILFDAYKLSYENKLYQFAYLQCHMIFMIYIYFCVLKLRQANEKEFDTAIFFLLKDRKNDFYGKGNTKQRNRYENGREIEENMLYFGSFAIINEIDIFRLFKILDIDDDLLGELTKQVKERNDYAHANGNMTILSEQTIIEKVSKYLNLASRVNRLLKDTIFNLYTETISNPDFYDSDLRGYIENDEQIKELFIREYGLSKKELNYCRNMIIGVFEQNEGLEFIKDLHIELNKFYKNLIEE